MNVGNRILDFYVFRRLEIADFENRFSSDRYVIRESATESVTGRLTTIDLGPELADCRPKRHHPESDL